MITRFYNPSSLELDFAKAFEALAPQLEERLTNGKVVDITAVHDIDNPMVIYKLKDAEGDLHEVVVQIIQRPDGQVGKAS